MTRLLALWFMLVFHASLADAKGKAIVSRVVLTNLNKDTKAAEVKKLQRELKTVKGVSAVVVAKKKSEVNVRHLPDVDLQAIKAAIVKAGFSPQEEPATASAQEAAPSDPPKPETPEAPKTEPASATPTTPQATEVKPQETPSPDDDE